MQMTGVDERGNARTRSLTFVADEDPPTGGALTVNDVAAETGGAQSWDADGTFTLSGDHAVRRGRVGIGGRSGRRRADS